MIVELTFWGFESDVFLVICCGKVRSFWGRFGGVCWILASRLLLPIPEKGDHAWIPEVLAAGRLPPAIPIRCTYSQERNPPGNQMHLSLAKLGG